VFFLLVVLVAQLHRALPAKLQLCPMAAAAAEALRAAARAAGSRVLSGRQGRVPPHLLAVGVLLPPALAFAGKSFWPAANCDDGNRLVSRSRLTPAVQCEEVKAASSSLPKVVESIPTEVNLKTSIVRLYQYESCPFCRKVRSCLDYHRIPYEIVEVHPLSKAESKLISPDYVKVPILRIDTADGQSFQLRDSKTIVRALLGPRSPGVSSKVPAPSATASTGKMWPATGQDSGSVEEQWILWTDKVLVQCIVLNVYRNLTESAETFQYLLTHSAFPWFAQRSAAVSGTVVMCALAKYRKRKYEVPDERAALYEACDCFAAAVSTGGSRFLSGEQPGAVDFNVYGILRSAEACQTERDLMQSCPSILPWYSAMEGSVGESQASNARTVKRGPS